jgi:DinB superfamily
MKTLADPREQAEIRARLKKLTPESRRRWGRMTAHQMVCHLADAFRVVLDRRANRSIGNWFTRTILKPVALYQPVPWPPGIPTTPELDQWRGGGTKPVEFAADLAELESVVTAVLQAPEKLDRREHPLFGPMSSAEWLRWGYLHMDHHLRQFGV